MATLTVVKFGDPDGAERTLDILKDLQKQELIAVHDAAIVSWPRGLRKPETKQLHDMAGIAALDGAFWGLLFGLLFFVPLLGAAVGAGMGALMGHFTDVGIDDDFIKQIRAEVTEGTSALFLLTSDAQIQRVADALKDIDFEIVSTNLSSDEEGKLREVFAH